MYPRFYPPGSHWAKAGSTRAHARLIVRVVATLERLLRGGPCNAYPSDMRLYVQEDTYFYPDAFVVCDEDTEPNRVEERDVVLVVEVRATSTSEFDRGDTFLAYQQLPNLREYLLLDNRRIQATVFRLGDDGMCAYSGSLRALICIWKAWNYAHRLPSSMKVSRLTTMPRTR